MDHSYGNTLHSTIISKLAAIITAEPEMARELRAMTAREVEEEYLLTFHTHQTQETLRSLRRRGETLPKGALMLP